MAGNPLVEAIKARLDDMEPEKRQKTIKAAIIGGVCLVFVVLYYATGQEDKKPKPPPEAASVIELGDARLQDDMRASFAKQQEAENASNKAQDEAIKEAKERQARSDAQIAAMQAVLEKVSATPAYGLPEVGKPGETPNTNPLDWQNGQPTSPVPGYSPQGQPLPSVPGVPGGAPAAPAGPTVEYIGGVGREEGVKKAAEGDGSKKKNPRFYLPPSFMPAKLLTGLAAKTVENAKSNPEPMMLRVQAPAVLPNEVRSQLEGCLVVAHGFGSLASERVEAQTVSISCLDFAGKSMIDSELKGIIVDKDGVKGLAGHPVSKMATNLARLGFAAAIQGAGAAFSQSAQTTSISALGQTQSIDSSQIGTAALGKGVEKASDEYAKIIADLVRQQAPVVEVGPAKDVTVVVTEGTWLEVKSFEDQLP